MFSCAITVVLQHDSTELTIHTWYAVYVNSTRSAARNAATTAPREARQEAAADGRCVKFRYTYIKHRGAA